jgi:hypothetical protein
MMLFWLDAIVSPSYLQRQEWLSSSVVEGACGLSGLLETSDKVMM